MKILNANWTPDPAGGDGTFEFLIITQDDQRHTFAASPQAATALVAVARAQTILVWDPYDRTLIVASAPCRGPNSSTTPAPEPEQPRTRNATNRKASLTAS